MSNPCCVYDFTAPVDQNDYTTIRDFCKEHCKKWSFQEERGSSGYLHYQGRVSLKHKVRESVCVKLFRDNHVVAHISVTSTENRDNNFYVTKEEGRVTGPWKDTDVVTYIPKHLAATPVWFPWQADVIKSASTYDERHINCVIDTIGCQGKSLVGSWLSVRGLAGRIPQQKEPRDIMRMIMNMPKRPCYFIDLPRAASQQYQNTMYAAIEEIKNGYCYDDRYSFKEEWFDPPVVWVFTNTAPPLHLLSADRWKLHRINPLRKLVPFNGPEPLLLNVISG